MPNTFESTFKLWCHRARSSFFDVPLLLTYLIAGSTENASDRFQWPKLSILLLCQCISPVQHQSGPVDNGLLLHRTWMVEFSAHQWISHCTNASWPRFEKDSSWNPPFIRLVWKDKSTLCCEQTNGSFHYEMLSECGMQTMTQRSSYPPRGITMQTTHEQSTQSRERLSAIVERLSFASGNAKVVSVRA